MAKKRAISKARRKKPSKRITDLERTAHHEAGHAFAAMDLRQPIKRASIIANEEEGKVSSSD